MYRKKLNAMGAFGIYSVVLTFLLVAYYAVVIFMDLSKKDKKKQTTAESFDVSDMQGEAPYHVEEQKGGGFIVKDPRHPQTENQASEEDIQEEHDFIDPDDEDDQAEADGFRTDETIGQSSDEIQDVSRNTLISRKLQRTLNGPIGRKE